MERNIQRHGLINLLGLAAVTVAGFVVARLSGSLAGQLSLAFIIFGALVAAVSWFHMRLEENERLEKLEFDELSRSKGGSALFETPDAEAFPAQRAREQFERFFVPGFTALLFLAQALSAYWLWKWLSGATGLEFQKPTLALALFALCALLLFLLGTFSATIARLENHRLLRPGASWLLLSAYLCFFVALGAVGVEAGLPRADFYVARGLCVLLGVVALETLVQLILEIYRPRVKGRVERPLYESRLVGLLGHPEGIYTTATQALDYQFGFKVSETWAVRMFWDYFPALLLAQMAVLLLSTSLVVIDPGEQGLLEHFGRPAPDRALLDPGAHLKWPWPIDRVYRYRTEQIQSFDVGFTPETNADALPVILWTIPHTKEENFLVASREQSAFAVTNQAGGKPAPPVGLLTVSIPIHFQITNLLAWAYNNDDPTNLLENVATREVVRYLVNADLNEMMAAERLEAAEVLRARIQAAADGHKLGARIVFVGLQDIHPPVKVAPDYEKVVSAKQKRLAAILAAQADDIKTNALASAAATNYINVALAGKTSREIGAWAQAALFTNQIPAYAAAPSVYMERAYLQTFARVTANARKYILLTTNSQDVMQFDLQDKIREDLLNLNVSGKK